MEIGRTPIIPIKIAPKEIKPKSTATIGVKNPVK